MSTDGTRPERPGRRDGGAGGPRRSDDASRRFREPSRGFDERSRGPDGRSPRPGDRSRGFDDRSRRLGDRSRALDDRSRDAGDTPRRIGDVSHRYGEASHRDRDAARPSEESRGSASSTRRADDATSHAGDDRPAIRLESDLLPAGPWIYGRQVEPPPAGVEDGALVDVVDATGRWVAHALYNASSDIRLRVLSRGKKSDLREPRDFVLRAIASADRVRKKLLRLPEVTSAYRIVHAEGDDLPGLVVDKLGPVLVCEHHALGFWRMRADVEWALGELYPGHPVVHKVPNSARNAERFEPEEPIDVGEVELVEHDVAYRIAPGRGHKTGFFCDQRDNRMLVASFARGQTVLDLCCNTGGFALQAARLGAQRVRAVDLDEVVLERARDAAERNRLAIDLVHADAFDVMRETKTARERPGVVVLDPHKIVLNRAQLDAGLHRYGDMNTLALECVRPGGLLATFSCSGAVELGVFLGMVFQSARRARRSVRLLQVVGAGPDHPQRPDFSRSRYLKGALLAVD